MRLLVTGGAGYLGSEVARQGVARGWDVLATEHHAAPPHGRAVRLDVRDAAATDRVLVRHGPDVVVHTAYLQLGPAMEDTVIRGSHAVAEASRRCGARLVHLSTDLVFDGEKGSPYVEDDAPAPLSDYGRDKADAEVAVLQACPGAAVVRTSLIYGGPEPGPQERLAASPSAAFFVDEIRCPIQVGDLADALLELTAMQYAGLLHVAGADAVSRHELAELLSGGPVRAASLADGTDPRAPDCSLSIERAGELLATRLRGAREVLKDP
jgi:dTDP-4-dehydrorhamnose reductase